MEYLPSRSLAEVLSEDGVLRVDQAAQIGAQVADALAATHAAGIVHRDVKPANILIGEGGSVEGLVKITDFGISHASGDVTLTQTGQITGTPAFLAPEVAQGSQMTEASDVFSLGATLYTCLEGTPPFGMEDNALGMLHRVAGGQVAAAPAVGGADPAAAADARGRPRGPADHAAGAGRAGEARRGPRTATRRRSCWRAPTSARPLRAGPGRRASRPRPPRGPLPTAPTRARGAGATSRASTDHPAAAPAPGVAAGEPAPANRRPAVRRSGRGLWIAAAAAVLVIAGLIALWAANPFANDSADARGSSGTSSSAGAPATESESGPAKSSAAATSAQSSAPTSATGRPAGGQAGGQGADKAAKDFFKDIPGNLKAAYQLTSPAFQNAHSLRGLLRLLGRLHGRADQQRPGDGRDVGHRSTSCTCSRTAASRPSTTCSGSARATEAGSCSTPTTRRSNQA